MNFDKNLETTRLFLGVCATVTQIKQLKQIHRLLLHARLLEFYKVPI